MTETITGVSSMPKKAKVERSSSSRASAAEKAAIAQLVKAARDRGEDITGPQGLLKSITATVLEAALEEEITDHLGHANHQAPEGGAVNIRNGTRPKTVLTDAAGEVTIEVPRDRAGTFEPVIVKNRQRRLNDVDAVAISLFAKGLTTGEISAHFAEVYGASISKDTVSRITDKVVERGPLWGDAGVVLTAVAPGVRGVRGDLHRRDLRQGPRRFPQALRAGRCPVVGNQPYYAAIRGDLNGRRDVLGLWAGQGGGESAKFWMNVLTDRRTMAWPTCSSSCATASRACLTA
jgi:putative transposase